MNRFHKEIAALIVIKIIAILLLKSLFFSTPTSGRPPQWPATDHVYQSNTSKP